MEPNSAITTCPKPCVLPVVFVPGIMGSRLKNARGDIVWDPPTRGLPKDSTRNADPDENKEPALVPIFTPGHWDQGHYNEAKTEYVDLGYKKVKEYDASKSFPGVVSGHGGKSALSWAVRDAAERKALLIGDARQGFSENYLQVDYGKKLNFEPLLGQDIIDTALERGWGGCVWEFYGGFLRWLHYSAAAQICQNSSVKLEIWAHPYNWTDDNMNSARKLADTVQTAYTESQSLYASDPNRKVLKPVVITHSMGGLVGRAFAKHYGGESAAFAMIHGAMPTHGAPAAYKRMRFGFEGSAKIVLGQNGAQVTAILANSPGGLQLLPNQYHQTSSGSRKWLNTQRADGDDGTKHGSRSLPGADPYTEIYLNQKDWWRLINMEWVNPGGAQTVGKKSFLESIASAAKFHASLGNYFHPRTKTFYCDRLKCWDRVELSVKNVYNPYTGYLDDQDLYDFAEIEPADALGDGTVHIGSGEFLPPNIEMEKDGFTFEHSGAFGDSKSRNWVATWLNEIANQQLGA